ncbi:MAG: hypothetical protein ABI254_10495 [Chthoniobacterales bacterium]
MKKLIAALFLATLTSLFAAEPTEFTVGSFNFARPEGWQWVNPSSPMRKAQLAVPGDKGTADVVFFNFGTGQGGTVESNVQRWSAQFTGDAAKQAKTATQTYGKVTVTYVSTHGTFSSGMPGGPTTPMENYALLGAILQDTKNGDVYVKLTGPTPSVEAATPAFQQMIKAAAEKL